MPCAPEREIHGRSAPVGTNWLQLITFRLARGGLEAPPNKTWRITEAVETLGHEHPRTSTVALPFPKGVEHESSRSLHGLLISTKQALRQIHAALPYR